MKTFVKVTLALSLLGTTAAFAADSPKQVLDRHVANMKKGNLEGVMADYADDTLVSAPKGIAPATHGSSGGPDVFVGKSNARKFFAVLNDKDHVPGSKSMKTTYEMMGPDTVLMHWVQFGGTPQEVDGTDVFVIRDGKIAYQAVTVDPPKK